MVRTARKGKGGRGLTPVAPELIARMIDHTLLRPEARDSDVLGLCREARRYGFAAVCVAPRFVGRARKFLAGSSVKVATVIDFPFGSSTLKSRAYQSLDALNSGAEELDIVIPIADVMAGKWAKVQEDLSAIVMASGGLLHKVILETGYLSDAQKVRAARVAMGSGAGFVKTSTGFGPGGATVHDVNLLRKTVGDRAGVKASGGIRTLEAVLGLMRAGASRIGTSSAVSIMEAYSKRSPDRNS